jgi:hypothetical protein
MLRKPLYGFEDWGSLIIYNPIPVLWISGRKGCFDIGLAKLVAHINRP